MRTPNALENFISQPDDSIEISSSQKMTQNLKYNAII
jgi:hypothetical protein